MQQPKRSKFIKVHRSRARNAVSHYDGCQFGEFGLKSLECGELSAKQLEAARRVVNRRLKRQAIVHVRPFPSSPRTAKAVGTRMGKGKGAIDRWVSSIRAGQIILEVEGATDARAVKGHLMSAAHKLSVKCVVVERELGVRLDRA